LKKSRSRRGGETYSIRRTLEKAGKRAARGQDRKRGSKRPERSGSNEVPYRLAKGTLSIEVDVPPKNWLNGGLFLVVRGRGRV